MLFCPNCKTELGPVSPSNCPNCGALFGPGAWVPIDAASPGQANEEARTSTARVLIGLPTFLFGLFWLSFAGNVEGGLPLALCLLAAPLALAYAPRNSVWAFLAGLACVLLCVVAGFYYLVVALGGIR